MTAGFYRLDPSGEIIGGQGRLITPSGTYLPEDHESYTYPIDGAWRWYESQRAAIADMTVPQSVTPYQARMALYGAGLLDQVEAAVAAADTPVRLAWEYATVIERSSPFIAAMSASLELTSTQVDDLFKAAGNIT